MASDNPASTWSKGNATFVFGDIQGYTALIDEIGEEAVAPFKSRLFEAVVRAVEACGGRLSQRHLEGDGFLAMFGYPTRREDDPIRAVQCAIDVQGLAVELANEFEGQLGFSPGLRVGVMTGSFVIEDRGGSEDFTGAAVNVAARLQTQAAPGTVLVGDRTQRLVGHRFSFAPVEQYSVRGFAEDIGASIVLGATTSRAITYSSSSFVGRESELGDLASLWAEARLGHATSVRVLGEAGTGKSRLVHEFVGRAAERHDALVAMGSVPSFGAPPYEPLRQIILECFQVGRVERSTLPGKAQLAVETLLTQSPSPSRPRRRELSDAFATFIEHWLGESAGVIVIDDAQWCDEDSIRVLRHLVRSHEHLQLLLIVIERSRPGRRRHLGSSQLVVGGLNDADVDAMMDQLLPLHWRENERVRQLLASKAERNPYYLEQVAELLTELPAADLDDTDALLDEVPDTIEQIVLARLDEFDDRSRAIAQQAAVVGRRFADELLAAVSRTSITAALRRLEGGNLVRAWETHAERPGHEFTSALTWHTIYTSLLNQQRSELHLKAAECIEQMYPNALDQHVEALAAHYELGGDEERAVDFHLRAQRKSEAVNASADARQRGRRSAALAGLSSVWRIDDRSRWRRAYAYGLQLIVGLAAIAPLFLWLSSRRPPTGDRTLGLPSNLYDLSVSGLSLPIVLGLVPSFCAMMAFINLRAPSYLRGRPHWRRIASDMLAASALLAIALLLAWSGFYLAVRLGFGGSTAETYTASMVSRVIRDDYGRPLLWLVGGCLTFGCLLVAWLNRQARSWRVYLGYRTQQGRSTDQLGGERPLLLRLGSICLVASLLSLVALVVQFLPVGGLGTDQHTRSTVMLAVLAVALGAVGIVLVAISNDARSPMTFWHRTVNGMRSLPWLPRALQRPRGLGLGVPLALAVALALVCTGVFRATVIQSFKAQDSPMTLDQSDQLVSLLPESPQAYLARAFARMTTEDPRLLELAIDDLDTSLRLDERFSAANAMLVLAHLERGEITEALIDAEQLVEKEPDHPMAYSLRSLARAVNGNMEGSLEDQAKILDFDSAKAQWDGLTVLCSAKAARGQFAAALSDCLAAVEANDYLVSRDSGFRGELVSAFRSAGRGSEAAAFLTNYGLTSEEIAAALAPLGRDDYPGNTWSNVSVVQRPDGPLYEATELREQARSHGVSDGYAVMFNSIADQGGGQPGAVVQFVTYLDTMSGAMRAYDFHADSQSYISYRSSGSFPGIVTPELEVKVIETAELDLDDQSSRTVYEVTSTYGTRIEDVVVIRRDAVVTLYLATSDVEPQSSALDVAALGQARLAKWMSD